MNITKATMCFSYLVGGLKIKNAVICDILLLDDFVLTAQLLNFGLLIMQLLNKPA